VTDRKDDKITVRHGGRVVTWSPDADPPAGPTRRQIARIAIALSPLLCALAYLVGQIVRYLAAR
jgi:hypothetical protein